MSRGRVYFIQMGDDGPIKIGLSVNPARRRRQLQTGQPERLRVLRAMAGDKALEAFLHRRFAAHHIADEWFRPHREILRYIIDNTLAKDESRAAVAPPPSPPEPFDVRLQKMVRMQLAVNGAGHRKNAAPPAHTRLANASVGAAHRALLAESAVSGWVAIADVGRVAERYGWPAIGALEDAGLLVTARETTPPGAYVHRPSVVARAKAFERGDVP